MKKLLIVIVAGLFCSAVTASDYGCKVMLCLANPNGPKAASACVPPINQLYHDLAHGHPFPSCEEMGNNGSGSSGSNSWANATNCHPDLLVYNGSAFGQSLWTCTASGAITITNNGQPTMRYWWNRQSNASLLESTIVTPSNPSPVPLIDPHNAIAIYLINHHCNAHNYGFSGVGMNGAMGSLFNPDPDCP